ncbi:MAG: N-acetylglucosamine-6-phosphate deacetylase [Planctomycetota bacterium]|nr:N-acetylglucosamine-6-phosphate deacetylase [Planctomycetota bacterium]
MIEREGRLLIEGRLKRGRIRFDHEGIQAVELDEVQDGDSTGPVIAPGLIDLHVHGFGGTDPLDNLPAMALALARVGTTSFLPTLFPADPETLGLQAQALDGERAVLRKGEGARVLGTHLEGPFVNPMAAGALPAQDLATPSIEALRKILGPNMGDGRGVGTITLAPELPGALDLIQECKRLGIRTSLGHSMANGKEAVAGFESGATGVTHLFNAMTGMHHRDPGLAGEAMTRGGMFAEIIGDLVHVKEHAVQIALAARGPQNLCLVSDALQGAGTGCDVFHSHGRQHLVKDGAAFYPPENPEGEPQLAGSASSQLQMVRNLTKRGVVSLEEALTMGSEAPARALGLSHRLGYLQTGYAADFIVLEGPELKLTEAFVNGRSQLRAHRY